MSTEKLFQDEAVVIPNQVKVNVINQFSSNDYDEDTYKTLPINRTLKDANIARLIKAFKSVHPLGVSTLTVIRTSAFSEDNGVKTNYLCDGHNRRKAAVKFSAEIKTAVHLSFSLIEIDGEDSIENVGKVLETINVNLGTWSPKDFTSHIAKLGLSMSKDYQTFAELEQKYKLGESIMLQILGLGQYSMAQYKAKEFRIGNKQKSFAILEVIEKIGFNNPKANVYNAFPHNYIKRTLFRKLISLDLPEIKESTKKIKAWLKEGNQFSYDEQEYRKELDFVLPIKVVEEEAEEVA
jgi:hypothetical protein